MTMLLILLNFIMKTQNMEATATIIVIVSEKQ